MNSPYEHSPRSPRRHSTLLIHVTCPTYCLYLYFALSIHDRPNSPHACTPTRTKKKSRTCLPRWTLHTRSLYVSQNTKKSNYSIVDTIITFGGWGNSTILLLTRYPRRRKNTSTTDRQQAVRGPNIWLFTLGMERYERWSSFPFFVLVNGVHHNTSTRKIKTGMDEKKRDDTATTHHARVKYTTLKKN